MENRESPDFKSPEVGISAIPFELSHRISSLISPVESDLKFNSAT